MLMNILKVCLSAVAIIAAVTVGVCFLILCIYFIAALIKGVSRKLKDRR